MTSGQITNYGTRKDGFEDWSNERLMEYEHRLYEQECEDADNWMEREEVIIEMNSRGLI